MPQIRLELQIILINITFLDKKYNFINSCFLIQIYDKNILKFTLKPI